MSLDWQNKIMGDRAMSVARRVVAALLALLLPAAAACGSDTDVTPSAVASAPDLGAAKVLRDQVFADRAGLELKLDLYLPQRRRDPAPLVVYAHGGGWEAGTRDLTSDTDSADIGTYDAATAARLLSKGYAVATVDYRLSTVATAPAQVVDVADAVRFLQRHAGEWGLDADRVALWGTSAGGHLMAQLGAVAGDPNRPGGGLTGVRAVVNWFGPVDLSATAQQQSPTGAATVLPMVQRLLGCAPVKCPQAADESSPIKNLSGDEPPFLIQHGMADTVVPVEQSLDFAAALRTLGVTVEMHPYEGVEHGFGAGPVDTTIADTVVAFLDRYV